LTSPTICPAAILGGLRWYIRAPKGAIN